MLTDQKQLLEAGAFAFTNDGVGVQTAGTMYLAMKEAAKNNVALVAHTEDDSLLFGGVMHKGTRSDELDLPGILSVTESTQIARDVLLAEATGCHYHVCHVSTKESVRVIRDAKRAGIHVTAEVAPHHLILIDGSIPTDTAIYKMNPPLRGAEDRAALIEGLLDGTIDCIATDHAPHGEEEKQGSMVGAPFGIVRHRDSFPIDVFQLRFGWGLHLKTTGRLDDRQACSVVRHGIRDSGYRRSRRISPSSIWRMNTKSAAKISFLKLQIHLSPAGKSKAKHFIH